MEPNPFIGTEAPAAPADLAAIEAKYGFLLPEDFKKHVLRFNGGWPKRTTFIQVAEGDRIQRSVSEFNPIKHGENTLEESLRLLRGDLHDDLVPFADEAGGDVFCLSVGPEDYGSVYYIGHEFYTPPKRKEMRVPRQYGKGVSFLAPSFTAFLEGLVASTPV